MKRFLALLPLLGVMAQAAQTPPARQSPVPFRIQVRHADPWFILSMLRGDSPLSPELSAIVGFSGLGSQQGPQQGRSLLPKGHIVINPADNTIWFWPDPDQ